MSTALFARAEKAVSFLAENTGVITLNTQRAIEGKANPMYALERIKEAPFDTKNGENPREIITYITQPPRTQYVPILGNGNETLSVMNPQTGELESVSADKVGRGCSLPADVMQFGYDVRTSCLKARAIEFGPFCVLDLIRKNAHREVIQRIWTEMPNVLKWQFARQLLREVITLGKFKFSAAEGVPFTTDTATFPTPAMGGPDVGMIRRIANIVKPWGWDEGAGTPMMDGRRLFQTYMGADAIEWAIETRKNNKGYKIETQRTVDDKMFGQTMVYEGNQFIADERPMRVIIVPTGTTTYDVVEIEPTVVVAADGEGFKEIPNVNYELDWITVGGARYRVQEVGFFIHPEALVRESLGAMPAMPGGKSFDRKFDFSVKAMPDWELVSKGCNKDLFFFGYRALHAFAMKRRRYELAGAFLYIAPKPRFDVVDPWNSTEIAPTKTTSVRELASQSVNGCEPCERPVVLDNEPIDPTCSTLFPANGVGLVRFRQSGYDVEEGAANLTLVVERYGGDSGAASVVVTLTEGTATNPENFGTPSGFAGVGPWTKTLSWGDGEDGPKTVIIPIVAAAGDDSGKQFTASLGTHVGAAAGSITTSTVTILDDDEA